MRKRLIPFALAVCALLLGVLPVNTFAAAPEGVASPQAAVTINGGLVYDATEQTYCMVGECFGSEEYKTLVVALYKQSGADWEFVDSAITCGSTPHLDVKKEVSLTKGNYKLIISATSPTASVSYPHCYNI